MKIKCPNANVTIVRDSNGIPKISAQNIADMFYGLGYCHAMDRGMQMLMMRILGQGRGSECLISNDAMLDIDRFFRKMNMYNNCTEEVKKLSPTNLNYCQAYCDGANAWFSKKTPWEFKLVGYKAEKWTIEHTILLSRMVSYVTLAQTQSEIERFAIHFIQAGGNKAFLDDLFSKETLNELDIELIKQVNPPELHLPDAVKFGGIFNAVPASNNWVVGGKRTASGMPIMANDPHLEINRLPNVWYEVVMECNGRFAIGASMPGMGGVLLGRTNDLAWGVTYTFMDAQDFWIEQVKDGQYLKDGQWHDFQKRTETIKRKGKKDEIVHFYENEHGVLENKDPLKDGYYFSTLWASAFSGAQSIESLLSVWDMDNAKDAMHALGHMESAWNWVIADKQGNIAYQMSGLCPKRRAGISGFAPLPGWDSKNDWQGFVDPVDLPRAYNPENGYFVTANNFLNEYGNSNPINVAMGDSRAKRIEQLILQQDTGITAEHCKKWQYDLYSLEAEQFMNTIKPLLPDSLSGQLLKDWDFVYTNESKAAWLFEKIRYELYRLVFGKQGFGESLFDFLDEEAGFFIAFYKNFNDVLFKENSVWFGKKSKTELYQEAIDNALKHPLKSYSSGQQMLMKNMFFDGKLPRFLGFDRGPITLKGGRSTVHQGQVFKAQGRNSSFGPSIRVIVDMAEDHLQTNLIGGVSDRRFSKWYCNDLDNWLNGKYKVLKP